MILQQSCSSYLLPSSLPQSPSVHFFLVEEHLCNLAVLITQCSVTCFMKILKWHLNTNASRHGCRSSTENYHSPLSLATGASSKQSQNLGLKVSLNSHSMPPKNQRAPTLVKFLKTLKICLFPRIPFFWTPLCSFIVLF